MWRIPRNSRVIPAIEGQDLVLTFVYNVPSQTEVDSLNLKQPINLQKYTLYADKQLQPQKHVIKYRLPPTVIRENLNCCQTKDFIAFQFDTGRTTNYEICIPTIDLPEEE